MIRSGAWSAPLDRRTDGPPWLGLSEILFVVFVVAVVAVPWSASPAGAIAYGEDAPDGDYRFSVLLTMTGLPVEGGGTRDSSCSGALIAPRWVITAGHCFRDAGGRRVSRTVAERTTATVGRTDLGSPDGREVDVVAAYQADGADVALVELGDAVTDVVPIRVATEPPAVGEVLRLTGFGLATDGGETAPATWLQTGQFTVDAVGDAMIETSGRAPRRGHEPVPARLRRAVLPCGTRRNLRPGSGRQHGSWLPASRSGFQRPHRQSQRLDHQHHGRGGDLAAARSGRCERCTAPARRRDRAGPRPGSGSRCGAGRSTPMSLPSGDDWTDLVAWARKCGGPEGEPAGPGCRSGR